MSGAVLAITGKDVAKCLLCRSSPKLTFEHIPPKSCYNNMGRQIHTFEAMLRKYRTGEKFPKGMGKHVLCAECNSFLGDNYVNVDGGFKEWTHLGMDLVLRGAGVVPFLHGFSIRPGVVGRQMAAMALAMSREQFASQEWYAHLRKIVWCPEECHSAGDLVFCVYLMSCGTPRLTPYCVPLVGTNFDPPIVHCEIAMPPFGYVIFHRTDNLYKIIRHIGLCDVSHFVSLPVGLRSTEFLKLSKLVPIGAAPLDYEGITATEGMI